MKSYEIEMSRIDWASLRVMNGYASGVPDALSKLLSVDTPSEDREKAYWRLENVVVVQSQVFEAAEPVVSVLIAALSSPLIQINAIKINAMELLFQIVSGAPDVSESEKGNSDLVLRCKKKAREGLFIFYEELLKEDNDLPLWTLNALEEDRERLKFFISHLSDTYPYQKDLMQLGFT